MLTLNKKKESLRKLACKKRRQAMQHFSSRKRLIFFKNLHQVVFSFGKHAVVSTFIAIGDEIDMSPIMIDLHKARRTCALPVVVSTNEPLIFRKWWPGIKLLDGPLKTQHPISVGKELLPDILIVPLLAFDKHGFRLGWGGGYYDRTIAELRDKKDQVITIGVGLKAQEVKQVPQNSFDQQLDIIVTEEKIVTPSKQIGNFN